MFLDPNTRNQRSLLSPEGEPNFHFFSISRLLSFLKLEDPLTSLSDLNVSDSLSGACILNEAP